MRAGTAEERPLIEVVGVKRFFGDARRRVRALDGVSLSVFGGQSVGVVGESGCGKTTLAKIIVGFDRPDEGSVSIAGIPGAQRRRAAAVGRVCQIVFQDPYGSLNPRLRIRESIAEGLRVNGYRSRAAIDDAVGTALETVGLRASSMYSYPHQFSGGERQRICIARALAVDPACIVCDEPVSSLDVSIQAHILNLLKDLQERRSLAYLFIAHDLGIIRFMADYVYVMYRGRVMEQAPREALFTSPQSAYTRLLLDCIPRVGARTILPSVLDRAAVEREYTGGLAEISPAHWVRRDT